MMEVKSGRDWVEKGIWPLVRVECEVWVAAGLRCDLG